MTKIVEAIYSHGVLEPLEALELPEKQRVRLTIEPLNEASEAERASARRALVERLKKSTLSYGGPMPTRDELHERELRFDTNILIYAADPRVPTKQRIALDLLLGADSGILLWQVACEFIAVSRKLLAYGFTAAEAWDQLAHHARGFPLVLPTPSILERARSLHIEHQWSFWDAMIVGACLEAGVTRLYSEDLPGRKPPPPLEIINPFA